MVFENGVKIYKPRLIMARIRYTDEVALKTNKIYIKLLNFFQLSRMQVEEIVGDSVKLLWPSYIAGKRIT